MIRGLQVAKIPGMWHDSVVSTTAWPVLARSSRGFAATGNVIDFRIRLGATPIESIELDALSRDDIPALLKGLQLVWTDLDTRRELFDLLEEHFRPGTDRIVGRPGMEIWRILAPAVLKQGLGYDFDRLQELANQHRTVREMLGHGDAAVDGVNAKLKFPKSAKTEFPSSGASFPNRECLVISQRRRSVSPSFFCASLAAAAAREAGFRR